jgi:hypothetical protein
LLPSPVDPPEDFEPLELELPESLDRFESLDPDEPESDVAEPDDDELSLVDEPDPSDEAVALSLVVEAVELLLFDERLSVL